MNRTAKIAIFILAGACLAAFLYFCFLKSNAFVIQSEPSRQAENNGDIAEDIDGQDVSPDDGKIIVAAVGDIMLSRIVEQKMIAKKDWEYPFLETAEITSGADIAIGNLETTVLPGEIVPTGSFSFRTDPKALAGIKRAGFDVLSLANNHIMNFGLNGLKTTLQNLDTAGISHIGAGVSEKEIYKPVIKEVDGTRFGFLAYSYSRDYSFYKDGDVYGVSYAGIDKVKEQVAALEKDVDVVVVSMHMGTEYETEPNSAQKNFARAAVDAGADLVIGHHPHVVETFEKYKDGYIIYSLGNFVFDQMWSEETRLGAIAEITFEDKKISDIRFVPIKIHDYAQPKVLEGAQAEMLQKRLEMKDGG